MTKQNCKGKVTDHTKYKINCFVVELIHNFSKMGKIVIHYSWQYQTLVIFISHLIDFPTSFSVGEKYKQPPNAGQEAALRCISSGDAYRWLCIREDMNMKQKQSLDWSMELKQ